MKKGYLSPNVQVVLYELDVIMASNGNGPLGLGDGDWGVQDDFV